MIRFIVTFGRVGDLRPAPGTWGSLAAVGLALVAGVIGLPWLVAPATVLAVVIGWPAVAIALAGRLEDDPKEIVIDEVAGQWLALCFTFLPLWWRDVSVLAAWPAWVVPFLLFRLFDIWKPGPVGWADRRGGALGVMLDDLLAGLLAGVVAVILAGIYHGIIQWFW